MTSVRLNKNIENELGKLCALTKRSKSFYIKEALEQYLEDARDYIVAIEREKTTKKTFTTEEVMAKLAAKKRKASH